MPYHRQALSDADVSVQGSLAMYAIWRWGSEEHRHTRGPPTSKRWW